ncbi:unnamed protein product [Paramecium pentaurelia]|uniref:Guanylate cyclase domain-containing protein n=1 Tax=Paramecium pentaurelia TaxID=43138 RepID=A0A8S1UZR8_9CILI|nr:unnamed protein product [Paramecium pentaurelia]
MKRKKTHIKYYLNKNSIIKIQFRNGETVLQDGYNENGNKIKRANLNFIIPLRTLKENIIYFLLLILQVFSSQALYFVGILLVIQQWLVDLHNFIKIRKMDQMVNSQEARVLKQWDECIVNKEIIEKIKERLNKQDQSESNQRQKSKSQVDKNSQVKKVENVQYQKKGTIVCNFYNYFQANVSIPFQNISYKQQQSNKNIRTDNANKYNQMSPLIYKDMALKLKQVQIMEDDPLIIEIKKTVPSMFLKDSTPTAQRIPINEKLKKMEKDKMNLIKIQNVENIMIGDVIILERNQRAPCDILVLHCNDENFCVQHQLCDYSSTTVRKPVVQNRSDSQNLAQFKKSLTGNIVCHEHNFQIKGFFQLKKDPQSRIFGFENFIFCQERLLATPWVLGIVVKVGNSCQCYARFLGELRFENTQFVPYYIMVLVIIIIQIIVYNQNEFLRNLRSITQIIIDNCIYLILMVPHFYKIYYKMCSIIQLKGIGTIDQKQIMSCHIDKYIDKQYLTVSVDAFIEQSFQLKCIIYDNKLCEFEEQKFFQFLIQICSGIKAQSEVKNAEKEEQEEIQQGSQVINYLMQSSCSDELMSQRECIINQIPKSVEGRFIYYQQSESKEDLNSNQMALIQHEQTSKDKTLVENHDGYNETIQRTSNPIRNSKGYQSSKDQFKQEDYFIDEENLCKNMMRNNDPDELNPLLLQLAMNHLAFSKLLITEKKEQKVKNKFLGQLDQKQVSLAKAMGYEFLCVNNVQNVQHYIIQINEELHSFKLVITKLDIQRQRLFMLFEMVDFYQDNDKQFILFLREGNVKKNEGIDDKVWKHQYDSLHYIYYSYCYLTQESASVFLQSVESNTPDNQLYTLMEQVFKLNIILGLKYTLKPECQDFMKNIRKSDYQMFVYTQNQEIFSTSILYQSELLLQNDLVLHFNQQNEEDLRAYFKQSLQDFSNTFGHASINSSQFIKIQALSSQKQITVDQVVEEKPRTKKIIVMMNNQSLQYIMENHYFKNNLKLILSFTKVLFLYQATQDQLNTIQDIWCTSDKTINLLYENQSLLRCLSGCQLQILQLQQFSLFKNQKIEKVDKKHFFTSLITSLQQRLIFEKCYFNEMQINSNTDVIIQGYKELDRLLFFQSPLLKIFFRALYQQTFYKTITFVTSFTFVTIIYTWYTLDYMDYLIEIIFYFYIYQFFLFSLQHYSFVDQSKKLKDSKDQSILLQKYSQHKSSMDSILIMILKHIIQGLLISCIFIYKMYDLEYYLYIFMSISINDWLYLIINLNMIEAIILAALFPIIFYIYILLDMTQNDEWNQQIDTQDVFSIILGTTFLLITNLIFDYLQIQHSISIPIFNDDFLSYLNYVQMMITTKQKKKTLTILQNRVNELFENIEQVDLSIQKLLLNQQNNSSKFGQWRQQIFKKAQTILMWKKKQIIQSFQLLFYHSTFIIIMYFYQDRKEFFLVDYLIIFCLQAFYFAIQLLIKLPTNQQEYLEYGKFFLSTAATISILFVMKSVDNINSILTIEFFIVYELSIKFHPIYDFRVYITTAVATMIGYIAWYIVENDSIISNQIAVIQFLILFSVLQYFVKSYFIQLEEDQAQNKLNFIEQNNKINDILGILLPKFIRDRLNETDQYNIHQNQGLVAIVFCDICNFDQMVIEEKDKIITFLDDIFRTFDKYCQIYGVQKIETVGKTYLASAGLKACEQELTYLSQVDPVQRALNLAEQMMIYIRSKMWGYKGQQLVGKIGIHYGGAISGVIGFHKPQFSLIGDTVNTTSRVCSTGLEDSITLSEQAFDQLKNENIEFEIRNVEMKGLGIRPTYIYKCKIQNKENQFQMQIEQDAQSKEARSQYFVRKNPEIFKKDLKKRKTILTQIDTMKQKMDSMQEQGAPNVFGIKPIDPTYYQPYEDKSRHSIQLLSKQGSDENHIKQSQAKPSTFKRLVTMLQNKFQLENYEPEIDELIDYEQLLNVILLKNEYTLEHNIIKETSFIQLLQISYYKKQMNQFVSYEQYQEFVKIQSKNQTVQNLRIYVLYYMIKLFCQIQFYGNLNLGMIILQWFCCLLNLIQFLVNDKTLFEKWKLFIKLLLCFEALLSGLVIILDEDDYLKNIHIYEIIFIQSLFCSIQILSFWIKVLFCIAIAFYFTIILAIDGTQIISIYFIIVSSLYNIMLILLIEQQQVGCFNQKIIFKTQQQKESQLLQYLLPKHILNKFLDDRIGNIGICDKIDDLTILFADIAGFTEYSSKVKPEEVLVMLKNLFVEFDRKCCDLNVYKLYTIGDCYVAIGMIDYHNRNPHQEAKNIIDLAFEMINIIAQVRKQINFDGLNMRIGVHTGPVFGGVMGTDIVRYDIYGPDVLIANKMESNGVKGYVQVSQQTKKYLEEDYGNLFKFELNVTLELKAIGRQIEGYLVKRQEEDNHSNQQDGPF